MMRERALYIDPNASKVCCFFSRERKWVSSNLDGERISSNTFETATLKAKKTLHAFETSSLSNLQSVFYTQQQNKKKSSKHIQCSLLVLLELLFVYIVLSVEQKSVDQSPFDYTRRVSKRCYKMYTK